MAYLVLGQAKDSHARRILEVLNARGENAYLMQSNDFPSAMTFGFSPNLGDGELSLPGGDKLILSEIKAVFWRGFSGVTDEDTRANYMKPDGIAAKDSMACLRTWFLLGGSTRWVNGWQAFQHHQEKPLQLKKVRDLGVNIPKTYIGNDGDAIRAFYGELAHSIFKPVFGGAHTELLTPAHMVPERFEQALSKSPITVQELIKGTNIRTYVIGKKVLSVELESEMTDFREDNDVKLSVIPTPKEISQQSLAICDALYLKWTAIDWRRDEQGKYYFLEANPSPMFIGFENRSGIALSEWIVDLMIHGEVRQP